MGNQYPRKISKPEYARLILAILLVQAVDQVYFRFIHPGLKFPDYFPIMFLAIFVAWRYVTRRPLTELLGVKTIRWPDIRKDFWEGIKYGALATALATIASVLFLQTGYSPNLDHFKALAFSIFGYLIFIPISALYEELHYRGVYLSGFTSSKLKYLFVLLSSAVFALVHLVLGSSPIFYAINIFLLGFILALLRMRGKSVIVCTGFHAAWNFILISLAPVFGENTERYVEFNSVTVGVLALILSYEIYISHSRSHSRSREGSKLGAGS